MALNLGSGTKAANAAQNLELFKALFAPSDPVSIIVTNMLSNGGTVEVSLFVVKMTYQGASAAQPLPVSTTSIIKGTVSEVQRAQCQALIRQFIKNLVGAEIGGGSTPAQPTKESPPTTTQPPSVQPAQKASVAPKVNPSELQVCKLSQAVAVGQRVKGTGIGSIYRVVALNARVKVATNIKANNLSVRVECLGATPEEISAVKAAFDWKGDYGSLHLVCTPDCPPSKVVGAILFQMPIVWDEIVSGKKSLEAANA